MQASKYPEEGMMTDQEIQKLRQKVARLEEQVARCEAQMAVHPEKFDDRMKGQLCRNWTARATFKKERDQAQQELVELRARLEVELGGEKPGDQPKESSEILDFVI
jgi:uncharacterized coiled-coil DUF342 family protein